MTLNDIINQVTPPLIWNIGRRLQSGLRSLGLLKTPQADPAVLRKIQLLEKTYHTQNTGCEADEIVVRPGLRLRIHPNSRVALEPFCYQHPEMVDELDIFRRSTAGLSRFLDIGALHGVFSMVFALDNPSGRALAVDASPIAFSRLLYNLEKNNLRDRITPIECAVSDTEGTLSMHYEWEHAVAAPGGDMSRKLKMRKISGTELCRQNNFVPDVIKIDVEGHEAKVLMGLEVAIMSTKPVIFLEIHPARVISSGDPLDFFSLFTQRHHYRAHSLKGQPFNWEELGRGDAEVRVQLVPG